ncbi:MAG: hypothetical protein IPM69_11515 [Ignavibacteria bacterium]|nr:hypothetical protein [Ignavibacteria bacterium]
MKTFRLLILSCCIIIINNGCNDTTTVTSTPEEWKPSSTTCDVTYTPNTIYFDSTEIKALLESDSVNHSFTFDANSPKVSTFDVGKILLPWRKDVRKIASIQKNGTKVIVTTDTCLLSEVIQDGTLSWDFAADFSPNNVIIPTMTVAGKKGNFILTPVANDTFAIRLDFGDYIYKVSIKLKNDYMYAKIGVDKKLFQGLRASFTAEGTVSKFRQQSTMRFSNSNLQQFDHINKHIKGDMTLRLAAAGSGNDAINFELPIVVAKYPIAVGPFIFFINVKIQVVATCIVPPDGSSNLNAKFSYDSEAGFTFNGVDANPFGSPGTYNMVKDGELATASSSSVAASFGVGFPRTELDLFGSGLIVPYVQPAILIGGDFTTGIHPCHQAQVSFIGSAGVNMGFAGMTLKKTWSLWNKPLVLLKAGDCP